MNLKKTQKRKDQEEQRKKNSEPGDKFHRLCCLFRCTISEYSLCERTEKTNSNSNSIEIRKWKKEWEFGGYLNGARTGTGGFELEGSFEFVFVADPTA